MHSAFQHSIIAACPKNCWLCSRISGLQTSAIKASTKATRASLSQTRLTCAASILRELLELASSSCVADERHANGSCCGTTAPTAALLQKFENVAFLPHPESNHAGRFQCPSSKTELRSVPPTPTQASQPPLVLHPPARRTPCHSSSKSPLKPRPLHTVHGILPWPPHFAHLHIGIAGHPLIH